MPSGAGARWCLQSRRSPRPAPGTALGPAGPAAHPGTSQGAHRLPHTPGIWSRWSTGRLQGHRGHQAWLRPQAERGGASEQHLSPSRECEGVWCRCLPYLRGGGGQQSAAPGQIQPPTCFCKQSFIETQPCPGTCLLYLAAFALQGQS